MNNIPDPEKQRLARKCCELADELTEYFTRPKIPPLGSLSTIYLVLSSSRFDLERMARSTVETHENGDGV